MNLALWAMQDAGLARVRNLLEIYDYARKTLPLQRSAPPSDVLRSAVVLLHAILEDCLRHVARELLPRGTPAAFAEIPLPIAGRPVKFGLGALAEYRGRSVDDVLRLAVEAHMSHQSFGSIARIQAILSNCGLRPRTPRARYAAIEQLAQRRHRGHEGDRVRGRQSSAMPRPLSRRQVVQWMRAVERFTDDLEHVLAHTKEK